MPLWGDLLPIRSLFIPQQNQHSLYQILCLHGLSTDQIIYTSTRSTFTIPNSILSWVKYFHNQEQLTREVKYYFPKHYQHDNPFPRMYDSNSLVKNTSSRPTVAIMKIKLFWWTIAVGGCSLPCNYIAHAFLLPSPPHMVRPGDSRSGRSNLAFFLPQTPTIKLWHPPTRIPQRCTKSRHALALSSGLVSTVMKTCWWRWRWGLVVSTVSS